MDEKVHHWQKENETWTRQDCNVLLVQLKKRHLDPVLQQLKGREGAKVTFQDIVDGYSKIKDDYEKLAKGAKDTIAATFFEFHPVRKQVVGLCLLQTAAAS